MNEHTATNRKQVVSLSATVFCLQSKSTLHSFIYKSKHRWCSPKHHINGLAYFEYESPCSNRIYKLVIPFPPLNETLGNLRIFPNKWLLCVCAYVSAFVNYKYMFWIYSIIDLWSNLSNSTEETKFDRINQTCVDNYEKCQWLDDNEQFHRSDKKSGTIPINVVVAKWTITVGWCEAIFDTRLSENKRAVPFHWTYLFSLLVFSGWRPVVSSLIIEC